VIFWAAGKYAFAIGKKQAGDGITANPSVVISLKMKRDFILGVDSQCWQLRQSVHAAFPDPSTGHLETSRFKVVSR
jgi:hypothetical protein